MNTASAKKLRNYLGSASWMRLLELGLLILAVAAFFVLRRVPLA